MRVILTKTAEREMAAIGDYIAESNQARAIRFVNELLDSCLEIGQMPEAFPLVEGLAERGIRRRVFGRYLIFYIADEKAVSIVHILHGARDVVSILGAEDGPKSTEPGRGR